MPGEAILPFRRSLPGALIAFADRRLRQRLGARFALTYAVGIGLSYGVLILITGGSDGAAAAKALVLRELATVTWVAGGFVGLSLAADWKRLDVEEGVPALLGLRGLAASDLEAARCYAAARRIALLIALPTLLCCVLAGSRGATLASSVGLAALGLAAAVYACVIGGLAAGLALLARWLLAGSGRLVLVLLVLVPHVARELWPSSPSVPAAVSWLIAAVGRAGGVSP